MASRAIIVFDVADRRFALDRNAVLRITPTPRLSKPPAAAEALAGFMKFGGDIVVVLRTHVLLGLSGPDEPRLYDHLILLRGFDPPIALTADRVTDILDAEQAASRLVAAANSHRGCVVSEITGFGNAILELDINRVIENYEQDKIQRHHAEEVRRRIALGDVA